MNSGKAVIITGAAGGIGRALAEKFAAGGFALVLVDRDGEGLAALAGQLLPGQPLPQQASLRQPLLLTGDLGDDDFLRTIVRQAMERWGRIDVLVNNAIWRRIETLRGMEPESWERTLAVGLTAPAFLTRYVAAEMERKGGGVIVNISSVLARRPGGISPAYNVCKGGLETLTMESAVLYGPRGIRVVAVEPGNIRTPLNADYADAEGQDIGERLTQEMEDHTPLRRSGEPREIADVVHWLCSEEASFITGVSIRVDGGFASNFNSYTMKKIQFPAEF